MTIFSGAAIAAEGNGNLGSIALLDFATVADLERWLQQLNV